MYIVSLVGIENNKQPLFFIQVLHELFNYTDDGVRFFSSLKRRPRATMVESNRLSTVRKIYILKKIKIFLTSISCLITTTTTTFRVITITGTSESL